MRRKKARRGELTANASRKILAELVEIWSGETLEQHGVESWLRNWVAGEEGSVAETTLKRYRQTAPRPASARQHSSSSLGRRDGEVLADLAPGHRPVEVPAAAGLDDPHRDRADPLRQLEGEVADRLDGRVAFLSSNQFRPAGRPAG